MDADIELVKKQSYLRKEVLEKGFSPEDFLNFLEQQGEGKTDLENWEFEDLKKIVAIFQNKEKGQQPLIVDPYNSEPITEVSKPRETINNDFPPLPIQPINTYTDESIHQSVNVVNNIYPDFQEEDIKNRSSMSKSVMIKSSNQDSNPENKIKIKQETIACYRLESNKFTEMDNLSFKILKVIKTSKSFFGSSECQYEIAIMPIDTTIKRKLKDFIWLVNMLSNYFPEALIPPLPPNHVGLKDDSPKTILYLTFFLNAIGKIKLLRTSKVFEAFITLSEIDFKRSKSKFESEPYPKSINTRINLEGYVDLSVDYEAKTKLALCELTKKNEFFIKLDKSFDKLIDQFEQISQTFSEISKEFTYLKTAYLEDPNLVRGFQHFSEITDTWSKGYLSQKEFFKEDMKYYFKYMQKEIKSAEPLFKKFKESEQAFDNQSKKMQNITSNRKKEEYIFDGLKKAFGFYMKIFQKEYDLLLERQRNRMKGHLVKLYGNKDKYLADYETFVKLLKMEL